MDAEARSRLPDPGRRGQAGGAGRGDLAQERGYERGGGWLKLVRDATTPPDIEVNPEVEVFELGEDEADGEGLSSIAAEVLDMPLTAGTLFFSLPQEEGWRCYTAVVEPEGEVVATGSMLIEGGVAQLGPGTTLEHARERGCNTALLRRRLLDAAAAGCHTVFVELGEREPASISAAYRNLHRAGFREAYQSHNWQRPALQPARVY